MFGGNDAQSAVEYLISWGWVLVVVTLSIAILYGFGVFKTGSPSTIISGFQGVAVSDAVINSSMFVLQIGNDFGSTINLTDISVIVGNSTFTALNCQRSILAQGENTLCRVGVNIVPGSFVSTVDIGFVPFHSKLELASNGTVTSSTIRGPLAINTQITYFIEQGLPVGSNFSVTFGSSTAYSIVTTSGANVSFQKPFGNYNFSVPQVTYYGCTSYSTRNAGVSPTSEINQIPFLSNCTTTFSETGLPSGQRWHVTYDGINSSSANTGSQISFVQNGLSSVTSPTVTAYSNNLTCASAPQSPQQGTSPTLGSWTCTTTFSETGLPSSQQWYATYNSSSTSSSSTGLSISITQSNIPVISNYIYTAYSKNLDCVSSPLTMQQGSYVDLGTWTCTTTFSETGLPSSQQWYATYDGTLPTVSTGSSTSVTQTNLTTVSQYPGEGYPSSLSCNSYDKPSLYQGSVYTFNAWTCTTTFSETGLPSSQQYHVNYDGADSAAANTGSAASVTLSNIPSVVSLSAIAYSNNLACTSSTSSFNAGTSGDALSTWTCTTTFNENGLPSGQSWYTSYSGSPTGSANTGSPTYITQSGIGSVASYSGTAYDNNINCHSSSASIEQGSTVTLGTWTCTTTFSETGLPSSQQWYVSYNGNSGNQNTGSSISVQQTVSSVTSYSATAYSANLACHSNSQNIEQGTQSTVTLGTWTCTTTFSSNLPAGVYYWFVDFDGSDTGSTGSGNNIQVTQSNIGTISSPSYSGFGGPDGTYLTGSYAPYQSQPCNDGGSSVTQGSSVSLNSWTCVNYLFITSGSPLPDSNYNEEANIGCAIQTLNWGNNRSPLPNGQTGLAFGACFYSTSASSYTFAWSGVCGSGGTTSGCGNPIYGICGDSGLLSQYVWTAPSTGGATLSGAGAYITYSVGTQGCI